VPSFVLLAGTGVEQCRALVGDQILGIKECRYPRLSRTKVRSFGNRDAAVHSLGNSPQRDQQPIDRFADRAIEGKRSPSLYGNQPTPSKDLEMLGGTRRHSLDFDPEVKP
jgi:hypothetical protein